MRSLAEQCCVETPDGDVAHSMGLQRDCRRDQSGQGAVVTVPINSLFPSDSPRLSGENVRHARALAESDTVLPPIIVSRATMRVIDGMHRLRAATFRGQTHIEVQFFDGNLSEAFILAVESNITHGLPLSLADRRAAAARIIGSHPQWSDRAIASTAGLSAKTVGVIRQRSTEDSQVTTRVGRDGRMRPLDATEGRRVASELITNNPDSSLREIASAAGISLGTAQKVRERLRCEKDPVLSKTYDGARWRGRPKRNESAVQRDDDLVRCEPTKDRGLILGRLKRDPSLRFIDAGRILLRLLCVLTTSAAEREKLIDNIPEHCRSLAADAARACADTWREFAELIERR